MPISLGSTTKHKMCAADFFLAWFWDRILERDLPQCCCYFGVFIWAGLGGGCVLSNATDICLYTSTSTSLRGLILIPEGFGPLEQKQQLVAARLLLQWRQNPACFMLQSKFSAGISGVASVRDCHGCCQSNPQPAPAAIELQPSGGSKALTLWRAAQHYREKTHLWALSSNLALPGGVRISLGEESNKQSASQYPAVMHYVGMTHWIKISKANSVMGYEGAWEVGEYLPHRTRRDLRNHCPEKNNWPWRRGQ